ncbi:diphosphomevalonate decarboxylase [Litorihabitans aurantiacus]|uniref:diphosphomevalonate decarboxylase n=1 Tax=Litorihabitans aurantiacus TaxID=1930061 RepID=A0AA37XCT2_9MICO|nr:diphosphomevalonate decarboxylase [Litorihabitans aurantiacus]GMA30223.1 diphosphomevalonate decarboxylase [Litorihabitans aurantiacus]
MTAPLAAATATAHANIALVKYWGKRDADLMLPATSSLSLTLSTFDTTTRVELAPAGGSGEVTATLDGAPLTGPALAKVQRFVDLVRTRDDVEGDLAGRGARVTSVNTVPTGAGLASSASGFAALAGATAAAYGLDLAPRDLSRLARRGSGSASRSVHGGFVVWHAGDLADPVRGDLTSFAEPVPAAADLDVAMAVVVLDAGPKSIGSREAMARTVATSPYFPAWVEHTEVDVAQARDAIAAGDLAQLGEIAEASAMRMHATMLAARPAVRYLAPASLGVLDAVAGLRASGTGAWATMDAGPNVKVLCARVDLDAVVAALEVGGDGGRRRVLRALPGPGLAVTRG